MDKENNNKIDHVMETSLLFFIFISSCKSWRHKMNPKSFKLRLTRLMFHSWGFTMVDLLIVLLYCILNNRNKKKRFIFFFSIFECLVFRRNTQLYGIIHFINSLMIFLVHNRSAACFHPKRNMKIHYF